MIAHPCEIEKPYWVRQLSYIHPTFNIASRVFILPDIGKVKPFVYDEVGRNYYRTGGLLAKAFSIGKKK